MVTRPAKRRGMVTRIGGKREGVKKGMSKGGGEKGRQV